MWYRHEYRHEVGETSLTMPHPLPCPHPPPPPSSSPHLPPHIQTYTPDPPPHLISPHTHAHTPAGGIPANTTESPSLKDIPAGWAWGRKRCFSFRLLALAADLPWWMGTACRPAGHTGGAVSWLFGRLVGWSVGESVG